MLRLSGSFVFMICSLSGMIPAGELKRSGHGSAIFAAREGAHEAQRTSYGDD
jgi:hypothetical protein